MELKPGYKQSELGIIPEDWECKRLESLGRRGRPAIKAGPFGSSLTKATYVAEGYKVYGQEQVIRGDYLYGDYFISKFRYEELKSCAVQPGDVLLSLVGTSGRVLVIPPEAPEGIINPRLMRFSFDPNVISSDFFKLVFESEIYQSLLSRSAQGGTMGVLNAGLLKPIAIPLPSLHEQRVIATGLSDINALLAAQDQLIAKKRDIKQAVMQRLLTGKQRLPGFSGEWETKRLGDVGSFSKGKGLAKESINLTGTMPAIPYTAIYTDFDEVVRYSEIRQYTNPSYEQSLVKGPVLLIASSSNMLENIGKATAYVDNLDVAVGGDIILYKSLLDVRFLAYLLSTRPHRANIRLLSQGSTIRHVYSSTFSSYKLALPPLDEQSAIAAVLSDMDTEIDVLQQRRDKTQMLKQGMMQELLTGRTRLV